MLLVLGSAEHWGWHWGGRSSLGGVWAAGFALSNHMDVGFPSILHGVTKTVLPASQLIGGTQEPPSF